MYKRSSSPENRDTVSTGFNQDLTFINTTQRHVSEDLVSSSATQNSAYVICTQEPESCDSTQKLTTIDFTESLPSTSEETRLSVGLTPEHVSCGLFPEFFSELPIATSSTQIPTIQALAEDSFESDLPNQISNQDLNVSSQPNQNLDQETVSLSIADPTLYSNLSPSKVAECKSIAAANFNQDEKIETIKTAATVKPDVVNEESTPTRVLRKGTKRANTAPEVVCREPRKRRSKANVNYCEELKESIPVNPVKKKTEKTEDKNKQAVSLKEKEGVGVSSTAKVEDKKKKRSKEDDEDEAGDMPKKKVLKAGKGKGKEEDASVADTEDKEMKVNQFLQSKDSFLTTIDLRELIPQWLEALPEEDRLELAPLLPEPDCEVKEEQLTIREGSGASLGYLYEAAAQWQVALALGGFEKDDHEPEAQVSTDPFKDENYERNWGERISRDQKSKTKGRGRSKKNK